MLSLLQLPPEILTLIYMELLTNANKEFWPQLRETNRTCFEAKNESDLTGDYFWPHHESHGPKTRPCVGEVVEKYSLHYIAPTSPSKTTSKDEESDDSSQDEDDDPRASLGERVRNSLRYNAPSPSDNPSQESNNSDASQDEDDNPSPNNDDDPNQGVDNIPNQDQADDANNDKESIKDEDLHDNDYDTSSSASFAGVFPNVRPFRSAWAPAAPAAPPSQHRQCTNHYHLYPAILSTNSHIHAGATTVLYGANSFHFALDFDDAGKGLGEVPWARHWSKMRDVHLTQNCEILGRVGQTRRGEGIVDRDHHGDEEVRDDLCGVIDGLLFLRNVGARLSRMRVELGKLVGVEGKGKEASSTAVLFDQMTKALAALDVVKVLNIRVTERAMHSERWKCFARNVARLMGGQLQIIEEGSEGKLEDDGSVTVDKGFKTRFVIRPLGVGVGDEVRDEVTDEVTNEATTL